MSRWLEGSERRSTVWNVPPNKASYPAVVKRYWVEYASAKKHMREDWFDTRAKLSEFNETSDATLKAAESPAADGGEMPADVLEAFREARENTIRLLNETAELTAEDVIVDDVEEMRVTLTRFEKVCTTFLLTRILEYFKMALLMRAMLRLQLACSTT